MVEVIFMKKHEIIDFYKLESLFLRYQKTVFFRNTDFENIEKVDFS